MLRSSPYYAKTINLEKYDYVTPFLYAVLIAHYNCAHISVSMEEVLQLRSVLWKAASVKQVSLSGMVNGERAAKEVWMHREEMLCQAKWDA